MGAPDFFQLPLTRASGSSAVLRADERRLDRGCLPRSLASVGQPASARVCIQLSAILCQLLQDGNFVGALGYHGLQTISHAHHLERAIARHAPAIFLDAVTALVAGEPAREADISGLQPADLA